MILIKLKKVVIFFRFFEPLQKMLINSVKKHAENSQKKEVV